MHSPLVSIGVALFNDEKWIRRTLDSIVMQQHQNLEIILSDDCSSDGTANICKEYAGRDNRIKFIQLHKNIGALRNHELVFNLSNGDYFMWSNGHDFITTNYISSCLKSLVSDPSLSLCCGKTLKFDLDGNEQIVSHELLDTRGLPIVESFKTVFLSVIKNACLFYGLFLSDVLRKSGLHRKTMGGDLILINEIGLLGNIVQRDDAIYHRQQVRKSATAKESAQRWLDVIVQPSENSFEAVAPWLDMAYEYLNMIVRLQKPAAEQEDLLTTARNLLMQNFGGLIRADIEKIVAVTNNEKLGYLRRTLYSMDLITYLNKARFFCCDINELTQRIHDCTDKSTPLEKIAAETVKSLEWNTISKLKIIKLYAGDIPDDPHYADVIGLSLNRHDSRHISHDITKPFPLRDNSIDSFQAEDVFEHIPYDNLVPIINEIFRILKPSGTFRLSIPDYGCDILQQRSIKDASGNIVFDPGGGGTPESPGHIWFPRIDNLRPLLQKTAFARYGTVEYLHYWKSDRSFVTRQIDYSKGYIQRTPDFDPRVRDPYRPMSLVVDLTKKELSEFSFNISEVPNIATAARSISPIVDQPEISFVIIVLNGMPFIKFCIEALYDSAHEILIIEGAVENCMFAANSDGSSLDGTVECIRNFPDPAHKIRLIQGRWPEKLEMQNAALEYVTGNYVWLVDSDEIYKKEDIAHIKALLAGDRTITQFNFIPDNFWKGFDHIFVSPLFYQQDYHYRRLFKYIPGATFTSHRPPTMVWPGSTKTTESIHLVDGQKTRKMGIFPYHYSYILDSQVRQKIELYNRYGWGNMWNIDMCMWFEKGFLAWTPERRKTIERLYPPWTGDRNSCTVEFQGEHPEVMKKFIENFKKQAENSKPEVYSAEAAETGKSLASPRKKGIKIAGDIASHNDLTAVDSESEFSVAIKKLFTEIKPRQIIETGTYMGEGTTRVIATTLRDLGLTNTVFHSIECNPNNYRRALENLVQRNLAAYVLVHHGLSVPNDKLPTLADIEAFCVTDIEYDDIFVDHQELERAYLYFKETDFSGIPDDMLGECLRSFNYRPDFVLLDSGGHMGNIEFNYLVSLLQGPCVIALDDIYHIKHHKSFLQIQADPRFKILTSSSEKFGFCIAKFTPDAKDMTSHVKKRILWIRTDSIGDNILAMSMLPPLKKRRPDAEITVLCQEHIAELYEVCPVVSRVITFNKARFFQDEGYKAELLKKLQALQADICLNSVYSRDPLGDFFVKASGAQEKIAHQGDISNISPKMLTCNNHFYTSLISNIDNYKPEFERHQDFLRGIGIIGENLGATIWLTPDDLALSDQIFAEHGLIPEKTIALFAGAQARVRQYEHYGTALSNVCNIDDYSIIALGASGDFSINQVNLTKTGISALNLSGKLSLRQSAAIISRCRLAIGAETGLAHIACAVGTPNVILLGGGHFGRFMPYSKLTTIACLPLECYGCNWNCRYERAYCVKDVAPIVLKEAIEQTLSRKSEHMRCFAQDASLWKVHVSEPEIAPVFDYLPSEIDIFNVNK